MILSIAFLDIINIYANLLPNSISGQGVCCKLRRQLVFYTRCDTMCSPLNHNRNPKPSDQQPEWVLHRGMQDWFVCGTWALQGWTSNASASSQTSWSGWQSIALGYGSRRMFMDSDVICSVDLSQRMWSCLFAVPTMQYVLVAADDWYHPAAITLALTYR